MPESGLNVSSSKIALSGGAYYENQRQETVHQSD